MDGKYWVLNLDRIPVCTIDILHGIIYVDENESEEKFSRFDAGDQKGQIIKALFFSNEKIVYENSDTFISTKTVLQTRMNELFGPQKSAHILKSGRYPLIKARHFNINNEDRFGYIFFGTVVKISLNFLNPSAVPNDCNGTLIANSSDEKPVTDYSNNGGVKTPPASTMEPYQPYNSVYDLKNVKQLAEEGDAEAMFSLGIMYYYGMTDEEDSSDRNLEKARLWLERAAEAGCYNKGRAIRLAGHCYFSGHGPMGEQSYEKCFQYHERSMHEAKDIDSGHLAWMLSKGLGCNLDIHRAEELYMEEMHRNKENDSNLVITFARLCTEYGNFEQAARLYESVKDRPEAAVALAKLYKLGVHNGAENPVPDYFKARRVLENVLLNDTFGPEANYLLGMLYFQPTGGFPLDFGKAVRYFHRAADDGGHGEAMYCLGYMYMHGFPGVGRDYKKAVLYYEKSYKMGIFSGLVDLALLYQQHQVRDYEKAFYYATVGTRLGIKEAEFIRAGLLMTGRGCQKDITESVRHYRHLAENGFLEARLMLDRIRQGEEKGNV